MSGAAEDHYPLHIHPKELFFPPPYTSAITCSLRFHNPLEKWLLFKIRTTTPKRYLVRPNTGVMAPGQSLEIIITLYTKDMGDDGIPSEKKHKFQVQSVLFDSALVGDVKDLWAGVSEAQTLKQRIKCNFGDKNAPPSFTPTLSSSMSSIEGDSAYYSSAAETHSTIPSTASSTEDVRPHNQTKWTTVTPTPTATPPTLPVLTEDPETKQLREKLKQMKIELTTMASQYHSTRGELDKVNSQLQQEREASARQRKTLETTLRRGVETTLEPSVKINSSAASAEGVMVRMIALAFFFFIIGYLIGRF